MYAETTATIVLAAWERAWALGPVERGLALLSLAKPQESLRELTRWTIGRRDAELLRLRQTFFGNDIHSLDTCPKCSEKLEVSFTVSDILLPESHAADAARASGAPIRLEIDGAELSLRAVTTDDLLNVQPCVSPQARRELLLRRCLSMDANLADGQLAESTESPDPSRTSVPQVCLSAAGLQTVNEKLIEIDPQADIRIAMDCHRCGHCWSSRFDIVRFLWAEIDAWAQRLLAEVHSLAFAYGWSEHDILTMSSWRRQLYLGMLRR